MTSRTITVRSATFHGIEATLCDLSVAINGGGLLHGFAIDTAPPVSVREAAVRIRSAVEAAGGTFPGSVRVVPERGAVCRGPSWDLPIAAAILYDQGRIPIDWLARVLVGELGLDGSVRKIRGAFATAEAAHHAGRAIVVPDECAPLALAAYHDASEPDVFALASVADLLDPIFTRRARRKPGRPPRDLGLDFSDVRGMHGARRALEIAAAGGHPAVLVGPPGIGKSMIARRVSTILAPPEPVETREIIRAFDALGLGDPMAGRPFRAPHHTVSTAALVGGGVNPRPGEVSLAHAGVLFLDEIAEFQRAAVDAVARVMRDGEVEFAPGGGVVRFPARFLLIASANPCACGWHGSPLRECVCSVAARERYLGRVRDARIPFEIGLSVPSIPIGELRHQEPGEPSAAIRARVVAARARLRTAGDRLTDPVRRVARTIAALAGRDAIASADIDEAQALAPGSVLA